MEQKVVLFRQRSRYTCLGLIPLASVLLHGCSTVETRFEIVDYQKGSKPKAYSENFDQAVYDRDPQGNIDIVLQRANPDSPVKQVIHIRSLWTSIPGNTVAHDTQINGTIRYEIRTGETATLLEGAGSLFYEEDEKDKTITGSVERAVLESKQHVAADLPIFEKVELSGTFVARHDPRRTRRVIQEMDRRFEIP